MRDSDTHEVLFDESGVIRWKEDDLIGILFSCGALDLDAAVWYFAELPAEPDYIALQKRLLRDLGYSLSEYLDIVGGLNRRLTDAEGPTVK